MLAMKTLGKDPSGSDYLASAANLSTLLGFENTFKDNPDAISEALRCVANALLLIEEARTTFISKSVNGGDICLTMLEVFILGHKFQLSAEECFAHVNRNPILPTIFSFYPGCSFFRRFLGHHTLKV